MRSPINSYLDDLHAGLLEERSGEVATYIPELGCADPEWFGVCLATTDGRVYEVGDTRRPYTIQSMSKPFTYGLALQDRGRDAVAAKVDVEPSGDAFNSISLEPGTGRPRNPMINAGAITAASLVGGAGPQQRFARILDAYSRYAGRRLDVDEAVFSSECQTGHRNRALAHMLRSFEILAEAPDDVLDVYFRQCSVAVDCRDVAIMAATLANGGLNPVTGERALAEDLVERVLSVMVTCGMYDGAGHWVDAVGLPAKSGVAGGIFAVLPGQLAISVFSPPLDEHGNSVRGVQVCQRLASDLQLHSLRVARSARSTIRASYDLAAVRSRRQRPPAQREALDRLGARAVIFELQGDLLFAGTERVVRLIDERCDELDVVVLDLHLVDRLAISAARMLVSLSSELAAVGKQLGFVVAASQTEIADAAEEAISFARLDEAREWAEERLLGAAGLSGAPLQEVALADHALSRGLDAAGVAELQELLGDRRFRAGEVLFAAGDAAAEIFLLLAGEVGVYVTLTDGERERVASLPPGSTFGELSVIGAAERTADVIAETDGRLMALDAAVFERLRQTHPALQAQLLHNMLATLYDTVARMTADVAASLGD